MGVPNGGVNVVIEVPSVIASGLPPRVKEYEEVIAGPVPLIFVAVLQIVKVSPA